MVDGTRRAPRALVALLSQAATRVDYRPRATHRMNRWSGVIGARVLRHAGLDRRIAISKATRRERFFCRHINEIELTTIKNFNLQRSRLLMPTDLPAQLPEQGPADRGSPFAHLEADL